MVTKLVRLDILLDDSTGHLESVIRLPRGSKGCLCVSIEATPQGVLSQAILIS